MPSRRKDPLPAVFAVVLRSPAMKIDVTPERMERFARVGFVVLERLLPEDLTARLRGRSPR